MLTRQTLTQRCSGVYWTYKTYLCFELFDSVQKKTLRRPNFRYWGRARPGTRRDFFVSLSCKTGSHNTQGQTRSFEILKIRPTVSEIHCTRKVCTHVRTYARCVCKGFQKRLDKSLKFQRISSDLVYCGNPSCKTDSRKKSLGTYARTQGAC